MDFLGIGPAELLFIFLIALIVLGPKDIVKASKTVGSILRKIVTSPQWRTINQTSREIRNLPNRLIREAGLEDEVEQITQLKKSLPDLNKERLKLTSELTIPSILPPQIAEANSTSPSRPVADAPAELSAWSTPPGVAGISKSESLPDIPGTLDAWTTRPEQQETGGSSTAEIS